MSDAAAAATPTAAAAASVTGVVASMPASELKVDMMAAFTKRQSEDTDTIEYVLTEHLRMSGVYWVGSGCRVTPGGCLSIGYMGHAGCHHLVS
jgi:hypothetical protein